MNKLNILISNDDGYDALGIKILAEKLSKYGNIYIAAPDAAMSGASHSFVLNKKFEAVPVQFDKAYKAIKINSTPVDCIRLSTSIYKDIKFDVVFSGINNGLNLGTDIVYSGTVAAAREAHIEGYPAVSISCDCNRFLFILNELDDLLALIMKNKLYSKDYVLNINFPTKNFDKSLGIRFATMGEKIFDTEFSITADGTYEVSKETLKLDTDTSSDVYLAENGYITLVPIKIDQTHYESLHNLENKVHF